MNIKKKTTICGLGSLKREIEKSLFLFSEKVLDKLPDLWYTVLRLKGGENG